MCPDQAGNYDSHVEGTGYSFQKCQRSSDWNVGRYLTIAQAGQGDIAEINGLGEIFSPVALLYAIKSTRRELKNDEIEIGPDQPDKQVDRQ